MNTKDKIIGIRVKEETRREIEEDARREDRSIGNYLLHCWKRLKEINR